MYSEPRCIGHPGTLDGNPGHTSTSFFSLNAVMVFLYNYSVVGDKFGDEGVKFISIAIKSGKMKSLRVLR